MLRLITMLGLPCSIANLIVDSLGQAFGENEVNYAILTQRVTLQGIPDQPRNIFFELERTWLFSYG